MLRYRVGRVLQLVGLVILPLAISAQLANKITVLQTMVFALVGVGVFAVGTRLLPEVP
jgi:hypothetical protein